MKVPFVDYLLFRESQASTVEKENNETKVSGTKLNIIQTKSRASTIVPNFVGKKISVYNGKSAKTLKITDAMVGYKLGSFVFTKKLGKSIHNSEHNKKKKEKMRRKITQRKVRKTVKKKTLGPAKKKK